MILIKKQNEVLLKVLCEPSVAQELSDYFTFIVPNAKHSPAFKNRLWDGKIRLFNLRTRTLYVGLLDSLKKFAETNNYNINFDNEADFEEINVLPNETVKFVESLNLSLSPREYQLDSFIHAVTKQRALLVSPTGSGKSLIIYMISKFYETKKILIIVPTTGLVHQMAGDFVSYGCNERHIHKIFAGQEKDIDVPFTITTWQSVYQMPESWFNQFGCVVGDEAHLFKANSLVSIMEKTKLCKHKFGLTGTLDGSKTNKMVLEGLFGPVKQVTTTSELIQNQTLSAFKIKALLIDYPEEDRKLFSTNRKQKPTYDEEMKFLCTNPKRNAVLVGLSLSTKGNTLLLFNYVQHGKMLVNYIKQMDPNRKVFFVYGGVEGKEREEIRQYTELHGNIIIVASYKTFSTGVNIKNLHNIIFGSPSKSKVRIFQSIGRGLRKSNEKDVAVLYDVADDLSWKSYRNLTLKHFYERIQMYTQEKFNYKILNVPIKG